MRTFLSFMAAIFIASQAGGLAAHEYRQGGLFIHHPWARPTAGESKVGAVYLSVKNNGEQADRLKSASTPIAGKVEIHESTQDAAGVMRMRQVEGGLAIAPGATVELKPGGLHIMLIDLKQTLSEGQKAPLKLVFEKSGEVDVDIKVEKALSHEVEKAGQVHSGSHHNH
jgi:hypothetical protein